MNKRRSYFTYEVPLRAVFCSFFRSKLIASMYLFCPTCGNLLTVEEGPRGYRFACNTCPYIQNVTKKVSSVQYPKMKEVDDVLGGQAAWENVDSTEGSPVVALCPFNHITVYVYVIQCI